MREQEEDNKAGRCEWTNVGATLAVALRRREGNKPPNEDRLRDVAMTALFGRLRASALFGRGSTSSELSAQVLPASPCSVENSAFAIIKSRRDDISVENSAFSIPKSRRDDMSVERWNNLPILTCHPYGILLTATIFSTDISSLRDFLTATTEINAGIACSKKLSEP